MKKLITLVIVQENNLAGHWKKKYRLLEVVGYVNKNYAGDLNNKKSIMGYCFFFRKAIITWSRKQQQTVLTSVSKVKYMVINNRAKKGM